MKKTAAELQDGLSNFYGTEGYHRVSLLKNFVVTDGVLWLIQNAGEQGAFWITDMIASYQKECMAHPKLREAQFWKLTVHPKEEQIPLPMTVGAVLASKKFKKPKPKPAATMICEWDDGHTVIKQNIPYTDFQLPEISIWVEPQRDEQGNLLIIALLPSEH